MDVCLLIYFRVGNAFKSLPDKSFKLFYSVRGACKNSKPRRILSLRAYYFLIFGHFTRSIFMTKKIHVFLSLRGTIVSNSGFALQLN